MSINLTKEQEESLTMGTHLALSANAGSGKTFVLVERYLKAILNDANNDVTKVVAITFTEKAASEMLERVINKVDDLLYGSKNNEEKRKYRRIRQQLSYAQIMTIHSFCLGLLQDYVIEANLQPNFQPLDDVQKYVIKRKAIYDGLEKFLNENNEKTNTTYDEYKDQLFIEYTPQEIKNLIELILSKPDIFNEVKNIYEGTEDNYKQLILEAFHDLTIPTVKEFKKYLSQNMCNFNTIKWTSEDEYRAKCLLEEIIKYNIEAIDYTNYLFLINQITDLCKIKVNKRDYFIPKLFKLSAPTYELNSSIVSASEYRKGIVSVLDYSDNLKQQYNLGKIIIDVIKTVITEIDNQKAKRNGIDFDDMLLKTRDLLKNNPEIAIEISQRYSNIMVDEFQDTNNTQYDIIKMIVPTIDISGTKSITPDETKLFIVGDEKQSIYRFRNADLEVFKQTKEDIQNANNVFFEAVEIANSGILNLSATFRMLPIITSFVNKVCGELFNDFSSIKYNDLVCGRNSSVYLSKIQENTNLSELSEDLGKVDFLITIKENNKKKTLPTVNSEDGKDTNNVEDVTENDGIETSDDNEGTEEISEEAVLVADYISHIVQTTDRKYSDIAILFRSRSRLSKLIISLIEKEIPFTLSSGTGFFARQEICDLISYLQFLNDPTNDMALLGIMLSPFFNLTYLDVINIHCENVENKPKTLWEKVNLFYQKDYATDKIKYLQKELSNLLEFANILSIPHLIRSILHSGKWLSALSKNYESIQIQNNVEKFITIARNFQNKSFFTLSDFIAELDILAEISNESVATEYSNKNAVTLQTIHSAKGLEYPVVILYALNSKSPNVKLPIVSKKYGLAFNLPNSENKGEDTKDTIANYLIKQEEMNYEQAEAIRLLYVAMTRAKDHLILSANLEKTNNGFKKDKTNFNLIIDSLNLELSCEDLENSDTINKNTISSNVKILNNSENKGFNEFNISLDCGIITLRNIESLKNNIKISDGTVPEKQENIGNIAERNSIIIDNNPVFIEKNRLFSFSEFNTIEKTKTDDNVKTEAIKKILGINNIDLDLDADNTYKNLDLETDFISKSATKHNSGIVKGIIFHNLMQHLNLWFNGETINFETLEQEIERELCTFDEIKEFEKNMFVTKCTELVNTPLIQRYKMYFRDAKFEYKLYIPIGDNFYSGTIDCLIQDASGNYEVWDWKTNKITVDNTLEKLKLNYSLQMKMYIYLLMYLYPNQSQYRAKLVFTDLAKPGIADNDWIVEFSFTQSDTDQIKQEVESNIENLILRIKGE